MPFGQPSFQQRPVPLKSLSLMGVCACAAPVIGPACVQRRATPGPPHTPPGVGWIIRSVWALTHSATGIQSSQSALDVPSTGSGGWHISDSKAFPAGFLNVTLHFGPPSLGPLLDLLLLWSRVTILEVYGAQGRCEVINLSSRQHFASSSTGKDAISSSAADWESLVSLGGAALAQSVLA